MKNSKTIVKTLAIALLAGAALSGCVAVPAYGPSPYGGPVYSSAVVVQPYFGIGYRGYYGGRSHW